MTPPRRPSSARRLPLPPGAPPRRLAARGRPSSSSGPIDALDVAILNALQSDGRASLRRVARSVGASVTTVSTRVRGLEELGVLQGFVPLVSVARLAAVGRSPDCVALYITPSERGRVGIEALARQVAEEPRICYLFELAGSNELMALASTASAADTEDLLRSVGALPRVRRVRRVPILRVHKERPNHPVARGTVSEPESVSLLLGP